MKSLTVKGIKVKIDEETLKSMRFALICGKANKQVPENCTDEELTEINAQRSDNFMKMLELLFENDDLDRINKELDEQSEHKYASVEEFSEFVNEVIVRCELKN